MTPSKALAYLLPAALALVAGLWTASYFAKRRAPAATELQSGILLGSPREIPAFVLTDQDGQPFANERLRGRWSLLFAGFTHCPDVCPTTLALMKQLGQRFGERAPQMLFLSVDPERDTPPQLKRYVDFFGGAVTGITGDRESLDRLCAGLGLAYVKVPGTNASDYTVDHSAALVLVDPQGRVAGYFQPPHKVDTLAADLARVLAPT